VNFAWKKDLSAEFEEQFKVAASECDQGRGI
jgi:hypothetical protein